MPYDVMHLHKEQIKQIKVRIMQEGVVTPELIEELLDHFCVAIEEEMKEGKLFQSAFDHVFNTLQEDELKATEMKTQELLDGKEIFYPNGWQSFGLMILLAGGTVLLSVLAAGLVGGANEEARQQLMNQYFPLIVTMGNLLVFGAVIAYAIREIRRTQHRAPIFSFRSLPTYVYGVIVLIAIFSQFWLEPIAMISPLSDEVMAANKKMVGNASPIVMILVFSFNVILVELLFRGIILKGLLMSTTPVKAIFWSSFFCACMGFHSPVFFFVISLMLGWIYWKTRSLYPTILLFITGTLSSYLAHLLIIYPAESDLSWWAYFDKNLMVYVLLLAGSLLLTAGLFYYLHRRLSAEYTA